MAAADSLIGEGLAPSPYVEMRNERDALRRVARKMRVSLDAGLECQGRHEPMWSKIDRKTIADFDSIPETP